MFCCPGVREAQPRSPAPACSRVAPSVTCRPAPRPIATPSPCTGHPRPQAGQGGVSEVLQAERAAGGGLRGTLGRLLGQAGVDWAAVWGRVADTVLKSLCCAEDAIDNAPGAFELFGYDVLLDRELRPGWAGQRGRVGPTQSVQYPPLVQAPPPCFSPVFSKVIFARKHPPDAFP